MNKLGKTNTNRVVELLKERAVIQENHLEELDRLLEKLRENKIKPIATYTKNKE